MSEPLVPEEAYGFIGRLLAPPVTIVINQRDAQRYAHACDDLNPLYFDLDAARAAGHRGLCVPPTFLQHAIVPTRPLNDLREDGLFKAAAWKDAPVLRLRVSRTMAAGDEWEWITPAYVGDTITAETRLAGIEEKSGSKGPFVVTRTQTTFTRDTDVVARVTVSGIAR